jgi:Predicted Zn-dependent protease (DUF2268)
MIQCMRYSFLFALVLCLGPAFGQTTYSTDPSSAKFITSDIQNFWEAFDKIEDKKNPFIDYLKDGSDGLQDFIPIRIENPAKLLKIVKRRQPDYEAIRESSENIDVYIKQIRKAYQSFSELYDEAIFPPTYFVIGAFNTGGTATESGLIIGVEKQDDIDYIPYIVAHELIHFNQEYQSGQNSLLKQAIIEGSADFIGEIISGKHLNESVYEYGNANEDLLNGEFAELMHGTSYKGWLYGSKGKKKGRPKDLGYWMGYKICQAYYDKSANKQEAINEILHINDFDIFLNKSGYLEPYLNK